MSENEWFFLGWGLLALGAGLFGMVAPEKAIRSRNLWADRWTRWLTFGRVKKSFGPFIIEEMGIRLAVVGGSFSPPRVQRLSSSYCLSNARRRRRTTVDTQGTLPRSSVEVSGRRRILNIGGC
jgi:hypothetical protein